MTDRIDRQDRGDVPPHVSVIIASKTSGSVLGACIDSFLRQGAPHEIEIIVARCGADAPDHDVADRPQVRVLRCAGERSIPELRAAGLLAGRGRILAMTEDHCLAGDGWLQRVLQVHQGPDAAVGGAVENLAAERAIDWAVYFCEYGRYMLPFEPGPSDDLPGPNVSYKREALAALDDLLRAGTWETLWHRRLRERGLGLSRDPRIVVHHRKHFTLPGFIGERYHYARSFAGQRLAGGSWRRRCLFAAGTPLLPALVLCRLIAEILPKRRHRQAFLRAFPYLVLFTIPWAAGECVGYICGSGASARKID